MNLCHAAALAVGWCLLLPAHPLFALPPPEAVADCGGINNDAGNGMGGCYENNENRNRTGEGFGGYIGELRRKGLDVVLVIDGTGAMKPIIDEVKARIEPLAQSVHRLVPIARIGIVVFGGKGQAMQFQPLTLSPQKLDTFLTNIQRMGGRESEVDAYGACQTAINKMDWKPSARKVIVLVGDSPPPKDDFAPLLTMIRQFKSNNGTFSTVDVATEEQDGEVDHEERRPSREFFWQTEAAYKVLATAGGGSMKSLTKDTHIGLQLLFLIFGEQWQSQVSAFGRGLNNPSLNPGP
jgi:von Willebrand factor type A domain